MSGSSSNSSSSELDISEVENDLELGENQQEKSIVEQEKISMNDSRNANCSSYKSCIEDVESYLS